MNHSARPRIYLSRQASKLQITASRRRSNVRIRRRCLLIFARFLLRLNLVLNMYHKHQPRDRTSRLCRQGRVSYSTPTTKRLYKFCQKILLSFCMDCQTSSLSLMLTTFSFCSRELRQIGLCLLIPSASRFFCEDRLIYLVNVLDC